MHEVKPKSLLRGRPIEEIVSMENSIAVCGSGTTGCHGFAQRHEFQVVNTWIDAQGQTQRSWRPVTRAAIIWWEAGE